MISRSPREFLFTHRQPRKNQSPKMLDPDLLVLILPQNHTPTTEQRRIPNDPMQTPLQLRLLRPLEYLKGVTTQEAAQTYRLPKCSPSSCWYLQSKTSPQIRSTHIQPNPNHASITSLKEIQFFNSQLKQLSSGLRSVFRQTSSPH